MFGQSRSPLGASSLFLCIWSIPVHGVVHSGALGRLPCPLGFVRECSSHFLPGAFGPFPFAMGSSDSFRYVCSIPVIPLGLRVRSGAFGPLPYAMKVVGFFPVRSVHSRAP